MHKIKNKKDNFILLLAALLTVFALFDFGQGTQSEQETSSIHRIAEMETEEEFYVVTTAEIVLSEKRTVSGNTVATVSGNTVSADSIPHDASLVLSKVNHERKAIGLPELTWNSELAAAAEVRAKEITTVFSHTRPDGSNWWTVNEKAVYGENLAKGYQSADDVMKAWMASPEHKDNILYPGFTKIGIAVYKVDGQWYWAQEFGY
ncbi:MAG: hypothetical protein J6B68_12955 [Lachnospiraceae bacterium]|nr:hypothetical protein [Lachnospiraceae bacterium]